MTDEKSSQAAELKADHGQADPSFCAGLRGFAIAHQPALAHQPAEGALDHPASRQHFEAGGGVGAFDHLDLQFGKESLAPLGERLTNKAIPTIQ